MILQTENLTKIYGNTKVVDGFSLNVEKGHIYGLIGPNGAGKTTIMKMLAGLVRPDGGSIRLFDSEENLDASRYRMSFMIEAPYLDGSMTARENMEYIHLLRGVEDAGRIDEVLGFAGLADVGKKQVKQFSLGMKQRLGIAMALLSKPEIMVLDEPINGLDPEGIVEIRQMLLKLNEEQEITILISSHILSELAELCTDFALIHHGRLIESFSREELEKKSGRHLVISTNALEQTTAMLKEKLHLERYQIVGSELHLYDHMEEVESVSQMITEHGFIITKLTFEGEGLEHYYLSKVGEEHD